MHVFHIRGFSGLMLLLLAVVSTLALVVLLPATFLMVLWNAVVYEGFQGPLIGLDQGLLLWGILLILFKLIFQPDIQLQFQNLAVFQQAQKRSLDVPPAKKTPDTEETGTLTDEKNTSSADR